METNILLESGIANAVSALFTVLSGTMISIQENLVIPITLCTRNETFNLLKLEIK